MAKMGSDPLKRMVTGIPFGIPAQSWNGLMDVLTDWRNRQRNFGSDAGADLRQTGIALTKNTSGSLIDRFGIIGIDGPLITPAANLPAFQEQALFSGSAPSSSSHTGKFAVALEPLAASGGVGAAVASGLAVCQVNVAHDKHVWADVKNGDSTQLSTSHQGAAQILYRESGSSGTKWAIVRIGGFGPDVLLAKTTADIDKGANHSVAVYVGAPGSEVDSGLTVTAYNTVLRKVKNGKWILLGWNGFGFYIIAAEQGSTAQQIYGTLAADISGDPTSCAVTGSTNGTAPSSPQNVYQPASSFFTGKSGARYEAHYDEDSGHYVFDWVDECHGT